MTLNDVQWTYFTLNEFIWPLFHEICFQLKSAYVKKIFVWFEIWNLQWVLFYIIWIHLWSNNNFLNSWSFLSILVFLYFRYIHFTLNAISLEWWIVLTNHRILYRRGANWLSFDIMIVMWTYDVNDFHLSSNDVQWTLFHLDCHHFTSNDFILKS